MKKILLSPLILFKAYFEMLIFTLIGLIPFGIFISSMMIFEYVWERLFSENYDNEQLICFFGAWTFYFWYPIFCLYLYHKFNLIHSLENKTYHVGFDKYFYFQKYKENLNNKKNPSLSDRFHKEIFDHMDICW